MSKRVKVPISTARAKLFQLTDLVRSSDDTVVVLEQRGGKDNVALVREARLVYLEARAADAEKREERPFRLQGSMTTDLSADELEEVLRDIRRGWNSPLPAAARTIKANHGRRRR